MTRAAVADAPAAIGLAFPRALAVRAAGLQPGQLRRRLPAATGIGLAVDAFKAASWTTESSFQASFALLAGCCALSRVWFLHRDDSVRLEGPKPAPLNCR